MPQLCIIPSRALQDDALTPTDLRALLAVGTFTQRDGGGVWASNATLAEVAGVNERHLRRSIQTLVERGYLRRQLRTGTTSLLAVVLDDPFPEAPTTSSPVSEVRTGGAESAQGGRGGEFPQGGRADSALGGRAKPAPQTTQLTNTTSPPAAIAAVGDARERAAPRPLDPPAPEPVIVAEAGEHVTVDQQDPRHRIALCVATNVGITARYGEQPTPIRADSRSTADAAAALEAAGVPLRWACRTLRALAMTKTPGDGTPPRSVGYFTHAVIDAWRTEQARQQLAAVGDVFEGLAPVRARGPAALDLSAPMTEAEWLLRDAVIEARRGSQEGQALCRARGIDWTRPGDPSVVAFEALAAQQGQPAAPTQAVA